MRKLFLVLVGFLPFISFNFNELDSQPWTFLVSIPLIATIGFTRNIRLPKTLLFSTFFLIIYIFLILIFDKSDLSALRIIYYFISFFLIFLCALNIKTPSLRFYKIFFVFWLVGVIIQLLNNEIIELLVGKVRYYKGSSFSSFAPEPVWFSRTVLIGLVLYIYRLNGKIVKADLIYFIIGLFLVLISGSFTTIAYLFVIILILLFKPNRLILVFTFSFLIFFVSQQNNFSKLGDAKVFSVVENIGSEGVIGLLNYNAFNIRILNFPLSLKHGLIETNLLGARFNSEKKYTSFKFSNLLIYKEHPNENGTVHGGLISFVYYFGIIGLIYIMSVLIFINKNISRPKKKYLLCILILVFFEGSLGNPLIPFSLGVISNKN